MSVILWCPNDDANERNLDMLSFSFHSAGDLVPSVIAYLL